MWEIQIIEREEGGEKENRERDWSSIFKTVVSSKYNFYANLIFMDFLNGEINKFFFLNETNSAVDEIKLKDLIEHLWNLEDWTDRM